MILSFILLFLIFQQTKASLSSCRCNPSPFQTEYYKNGKRGTPFSRAKAMSNKTSLDGSRIKYTMYVEQVYADCIENIPRVQLLYTSSGACGLHLELGQDYILPLKRDGSATKISSCKTAVEYASLTSEQERFLWTRTLRSCSGKITCGWGQMPYACSHARRGARPAKPCRRAKRYTFNDCDGCRPEWFTWTGLPACFEKNTGETGDTSFINPTGMQRDTEPQVNSITLYPPKEVEVQATKNEVKEAIGTANKDGGEVKKEHSVPLKEIQHTTEAIKEEQDKLMLAKKDKEDQEGGKENKAISEAKKEILETRKEVDERTKNEELNKMILAEKDRIDEEKEGSKGLGETKAEKDQSKNRQENFKVNGDKVTNPIGTGGKLQSNNMNMGSAMGGGGWMLGDNMGPAFSKLK